MKRKKRNNLKVATIKSLINVKDYNKQHKKNNTIELVSAKHLNIVPFSFPILSL